MDRQLQAKQDIQRALFPEQYQSLEAGEQDVLVIVKENTNAITRGVAILMGEAGKSMISHTGLAPLAAQLNPLGWVTMLVQTPDIGLSQPVNEQLIEPPQEPIELDILPKSPGTSIDQQHFLIHEQQLLQQLQAVLQRSSNYPGFILVISQGTTAAWLAKIYAEKQLAVPDAFVAISPYWPSRNHNRQLADYIATSDMPVLDLYNAQDNEWSLQSYPARQIAATRALKLHYRQREIIGIATHNQQSDYLSKEIYGWLSYLGW